MTFVREFYLGLYFYLNFELNKISLHFYWCCKEEFGLMFLTSGFIHIFWF